MGLRDWLQRRAEAREASSRFATAATRTRDVRGPTPQAPSGRPARPQGGLARWVPAGEVVEIAGLSLPGMLYIGRAAAAISEWRGTEPALIDGALPVDHRRPAWQGEGMGYWPSYDQIPASCRAAYLSWIANGRQGGAYIGYVFLFFYGLERRALVDAQTDPTAEAELPAIRAEVARLLSLFGENRSFHGYATAFLDTLDVLTATGAVYDGPPPEPVNWWELPARLKVGLGQLAAEGKPVPAPWALAWVRAHPEARLRTPAKRCPAEFAELFGRRYAARYGDGLVLKANKAKLVVSYRPASASFGGTVELTVGSLPDVSVLTAPVRKLSEIADACTDDLDAYSRWLGRHPEGGGSLQAAALVPAELLAGQSSAALDSLREWAEGRLGNSTEAAIDASELIQHWPDAPKGKLGKAESGALCGLLGRLGFGVEPDVRFGGPPLAPGPAILFRDGDDAVPGQGYAASTVLLHLATTVSAADAEVSTVEQQHLAQHLEDSLHLGPAERCRLHAHLTWLTTAKPGLGGIKKRLGSIDLSQRSAIGAFLVTVAGADGSVAPAEVNALTKMFGLLGLDQADVYSQLHALAAPDRGPVVVRPAQPTAPGEPVPSARVVTLDPARVRARLADSDEVAALLATVFVDDEPTPSIAPVDDRQDSTIAGLDSAHIDLLRALAAKPRWASAEIDAQAAAVGLLPAGAMDTLNEASIDASGDPLCEMTDDGIEINGYALEVLLQ